MSELGAPRQPCAPARTVAELKATFRESRVMNRSFSHAPEEAIRENGLPSHEEIRGQLRLILRSSSCRGSRRCQQFLEYACEKALKGDIGALKERAIAVQVFGRRPETTLGDDTIVRVGAREVRKRLAQFYV